MKAYPDTLINILLGTSVGAFIGTLKDTPTGFPMSVQMSIPKVSLEAIQWNIARFTVT